MSRSGGYTTAGDRSRRRIATLIIVVGVVVVVGWIAAVAALAGGGEGSQQGGAEGGASDSSSERSSQEQVSADAPPETPSQTPSETNADQESESSSESSSESAPQPSSGEQGEAPTDGQTDPRQDVAGEAQTGEVFDLLEEEEKGSGGQPDGSTGGEQAGPGGLSETDRTRARAASERYVVAAYGYTGGSEDDYLQGIEQAASEEIYDSPGGEKLEGYSQAAPECGMRSTAILEEFEVLGRSAKGLDVSASFSVEDGASDNSDGQRHTFSQDQRLISSSGAYEVSGVSVEELTSETTPTESCPGADSGKDDSSKDDSNKDEEKDPESVPDSASPTDRDRARAAADRYVTASYGYTGESGKEYREGIGRTASTPQLYSSPGGERLRQYAASAEKDGITAAAVMESFEITSTEGSRIQGIARFRVGDSYDRYGGLRGDSTGFRQRLTLSPVRSAYEVSRAGAERETPQQEASRQEASERADVGPEKKTR